jgi:hypothetical protein
MKPLALVLPFVGLFLVVAAFQSGVGLVTRQVSSRPAAFPTVTPLQLPLCGKNNRNCSWESFNYDPQQPPPFKGLTLTDPPR